jgi:hypothetical protein
MFSSTCWINPDLSTRSIVSLLNHATSTKSHPSLLNPALRRPLPPPTPRRVGDPFSDVDQGPQVDQDQFNKILNYIKIGQEEGASLR